MMGETTASSSSEIASISAKIMIATITVVFLLMFFFFCIYIYAKCHMSITYLEDPTIVSWRRRTARRATAARSAGLDASELGSIPIVVYNPDEFKEGLECAVCLSEVSKGEKARILPKCNHGFHVNCIDLWLQSNSTCPICRNPIIVITNNGVELQEIGSTITTSSSSSSDDDEYASMEAPNLPTNILFWGNQTLVGEEERRAEEGSSSELVIEVPIGRHVFEEEETEKSPAPVGSQSSAMMTRMMSFKRLLSRGKRVAAASPRASSSAVDVEQQV